MTTYWNVPEDISLTWSKLRPLLETVAMANPNKMMAVCLISDAGLFSELADPEFSSIEPKAQQFGAGREWWSFIRRLISVSNKNGRYLIESTIRLDGNGQPINWTRPSVRKLEPRKRR